MLRRFIHFEDARVPHGGQVHRRHRRRFAITVFMLVVLVVALGTAGCSPGVRDGRVRLPVTPVISVRPRWAVTTSTYVRVRVEPSTDAAINGHMRMGDVAEIRSISTRPYESGGTMDLWYEIDSDGLSGWVPGDSLEFYESQSRARNATSLLFA